MKAKTHLSQNKSRGGFTLVEMLVVIGMIATLAGISFPVYKSIQKKVEKQQFELILTAMERAVDNFETEYNYLPYIGAAYPGGDAEKGDCITATDDFITVLAGVGSNTPNFKSIRFFECQEPSGGPGNYKNGLLINGASAELYLPWGTPLDQIWVDYDLDGSITHPYWWGGPPTNAQIIYLSWGEDGLVAGGSGWASNPVNNDNLQVGLAE